MRLFCLLCFVLSALIGRSQPFQTDSADQSVVVPLYLATEVWVYFTNLGQDTLQLRWRRMQEDVPVDWHVDLCDYGACYTGVPPSAYMNPAPPAASPFIKLIVQPDDLEGEGFYWFRIYNAADETQFLDITISIATPGMVSSMQQIASQSKLSLYPNPVQDVLHMRSDDSQWHDARIYHSSGRLFWQGHLSTITSTLNVASWPSGMYILTSTKGSQSFLIQH